MEAKKMTNIHTTNKSGKTDAVEGLRNNSSTSSLKIAYLSNTDLLFRFGKLVQTERKITHLVLECIAEIDSRRLYLDKAYPSLYEFLVQKFGYSSSAALRRIESARLLREVPEVASKIESGALNLSQLSKVQQAVRAVQKIEDRKLDVTEKQELLKCIENTTQQQTEVILSQALSLPILDEDKAKAHGDESVTLTITLSKEQMAILKQAQDLIAHAVPDKKWADTITYLAQKEIQRRTQLKKPHSTKESSPLSSTQSQDKNSSTITTVTTLAGVAKRKIIPRGIKKQILNKDRCCQYKDPNTGKVCGSTRFTQVDHRHSVWAGGSNNIANLQILCFQHNQHKYRRETFLINFRET